MSQVGARSPQLSVRHLRTPHRWQRTKLWNRRCGLRQRGARRPDCAPVLSCKQSLQRQKKQVVQCTRMRPWLIKILFATQFSTAIDCAPYRRSSCRSLSPHIYIHRRQSSLQQVHRNRRYRNIRGLLWGNHHTQQRVGRLLVKGSWRCCSVMALLLNLDFLFKLAQPLHLLLNLLQVVERALKKCFIVQRARDISTTLMRSKKINDSYLPGHRIMIRAP